MLLIAITFFFVVNLWMWGNVSQNILENYQAGGNLTDDARASLGLSANNYPGFLTTAFTHENNAHLWSNALGIASVLALIFILERENPKLRTVSTAWLITPLALFQLIILGIYTYKNATGYFVGLSAFGFLATGFFLAYMFHNRKRIWPFWKKKILRAMIPQRFARSEGITYLGLTLVVCIWLIALPIQFSGFFSPATASQEAHHIYGFMLGLLAGYLYCKIG